MPPIMTVVTMRNVQSAVKVSQNVSKFARESHVEDRLLVLELITNHLVLVLKGISEIL